MDNIDKIIIIGTGVFGLSTADHVHESHPGTPLSIISRPCDLAPSDDIAKIVRVDYNNLNRMTEAVELQKKWNNDPFTNGYRTIGRITIFEPGDSGTIDQINIARKKLRLPSRETYGNELMQKYFETTTAPDELLYLFNSDDAIVDWKLIMSEARQRSREACVNSGGSFYESGVATLVHDKDKGCITAVELENGARIETETAQVVLATGPWFSQDLATFHIPLPPSTPSGRIPTANGLFAYTIELSDEQAKYFRDKPMVSHQGKAEFLPPPTADGTRGKLTWIEPFTNLCGSPATSQVNDLSRSALAKSHMHKAIDWARTFLPALKGAHITSVTSFWDGVTQTHDPIVARHPQFQNLVCAAGGSFNRAKDLPTIGSVVTKVLNDQEVHARYGWNPNKEYSQQDEPNLLTRGDFTALEEQAEADMRQSPAVLKQSCLAVI